jgi:hypothetical protein
MIDSASRNIYYEDDSKQIVRVSQEENAQSVPSPNLVDFGKRLREAFNNAF